MALIAAGAWLQWQPALNLQALLAINAAAGGPASWAATLWASLSVAGLGLSLILILAALDRGPGQRLAAGLWCLPLAWLLSLGTKAWLQTPRPSWLLSPDQLMTIGEPVLGSFAMPSGHALSAFALATVLSLSQQLGAASAAGLAGGDSAAAAAKPPSAWRRRVAMALLWGLVIAVAVSRLAVGAHWPSDLLVGAGLGLLSGCAAIALNARWPLAGLPGLAGAGQGLASVAGRRALALVELSLALALMLSHTGYPQAIAMQWAIALLGIYSGISRWRHAREAPGADAPVAKLVGPCLGAGLLLSLLLGQTSGASLLQAWRSLPGWLLGLLLLGLWGSYALRAERMRREWGAWGRAQTPPAAPLRFADGLDIFLAHNAALVLLPMRAGEAGYPWLLKQRWGIPVAESVRSLVWLRLQDATVLGLLGLLFLAPGGWLLRCLAVAAALLALMVLLPRISDRLAQRWPRWQAMQGNLLAHRADRLGWALCAANWLLKLAVLGGALAWLSGLSVWQGFGAAVAGDLAAALPLQAPAGLGSYEAAVWAAGQWQGAQVPLANLASAALMVHLLSLASALLSFAFFRVVLTARLRLARVGSNSEAGTTDC